MTASLHPLLIEIAAGHTGPPIPKATLAYFQQRLRNRVFDILLHKFVEEKEKGLTKAILARRIGKTPDVVNRWLGAPSNLTLDTLCDLLIGLSGEEIEPHCTSPVRPRKRNFSHFASLRDANLTASNQVNGALLQAKGRTISSRPSRKLSSAALGARSNYEDSHQKLGRGAAGAL